MKVPLYRFMDHITAQNGDKYVFASEAAPTDPDPNRFDCSELIQWGMEFSARKEGSSLAFPDGSMNQRAHCTQIPVQKALHTRGALLFRDVSVTGVGHVAVSMGDARRTFEARGSAFGCLFAPAIEGRVWTSGGLIPEVDYDAKRKPELIDRGIVFGRGGGRFGQFNAQDKRDDDERMVKLIRRAERETWAAIFVIRKEPRDLDLADDFPAWKANRIKN